MWFAVWDFALERKAREFAGAWGGGAGDGSARCIAAQEPVYALRFEVWGLGFGICGLGFVVCGLRCADCSFWCTVCDSKFVV